MTKNVQLLACLLGLLFFTTCSEKKENRTPSSILTLKLSGVEGNKLFVQELRDRSWISVDSVLNYETTAIFSVQHTEPDYYRIVDVTGKNMGIVILTPGDSVTVEGNLKEMISSFTSPDSKENNDYYTFHRRLSSIRANEEAWSQKYEQFMQTSQTEDSARYYMDLLSKMQDESDAFVKASIDSVMPSFAVYSMVNYLRMEKEFDYLYTLADRIKNEMPDTKYSRLFVGEIFRMKTYKDEQAAKEAKGKVVVGKLAPDFAMNDRNGNSISLSSFRGKYVLIDFWASWCGPCRAESPNMVKLYQKFKGKNFEILGVSLDGAESAWKSAIQKDGLTWIHVSDLMQWNSPVVSLYEIQGIPFTVIVDPNGIVVAKNLRGDQLMTKLEELL